MDYVITQSDYDDWNQESLDPVTRKLLFLRLPLSVVEKHFGNWVNFENGKDFPVSFRSSSEVYPRVSGGVRRVKVNRSNVVNLLLPQNLVGGRQLFLSTDSSWTAVLFAPRGNGYIGTWYIEDFIKYLFCEEVLDWDCRMNVVSLECEPFKGIDKSVDGIPGAKWCPHEYLASPGSCRISMEAYYFDSLKQATVRGPNLSIGHRGVQRWDGVRFENGLWNPKTGVSYVKKVSYGGIDDFEFPCSELLKKLPESFEDDGPVPTVGPDIWKIFGRAEMEQLCAAVGIRPTDPDFFKEDGLLTWYHKVDRPWVEPQPRVDFKHYQRVHGFGPDVLWPAKRKKE